jgi:hypothetical protein
LVVLGSLFVISSYRPLQLTHCRDWTGRCERRGGSQHSWPCQFCEDLILGSERSCLTFSHHKDVVDSRQDVLPVRNHDGNAAPCSNAQYRLGQCIFTLSIEIRVGLIQNDQEGRAVKRSSQPDPLPLSAGKQNGYQPEEPRWGYEISVAKPLGLPDLPPPRETRVLHGRE